MLCKQSPYFAATFNGEFKEGKEQSTTLEEIDGVVSTQSFQMLAQWICLGQIIFEDAPPEEQISAAIEFTRLADMCGVTGMELMIAEHINDTIAANAAPHYGSVWRRNHNANTSCVTLHHITSAANLCVGHPVRSKLANSAVEEYLCLEEYKLVEESREVPSFSSDLLLAIKNTLKTMKCEDGRIEFKEPISGDTLWLYKG